MSRPPPSHTTGHTVPYPAVQDPKGSLQFHEATHLTASDWASLIARIYDVLPLVCPGTARSVVVVLR